MRTMRCDQSEAAIERTTTRTAMGFQLSAVRRYAYSASHDRGQALISFVGLRHQQTGSGTVLPDSLTLLRHPDGGAALLQCLWNATGAVEPIHRCVRDLFRALVE